MTAGHDNWFENAYSGVVERLLAPIYEAIGMDLEVLNIAEGNNDCQVHLSDTLLPFWSAGSGIIHICIYTYICSTYIILFGMSVLRVLCV